MVFPFECLSLCNLPGLTAPILHTDIDWQISLTLALQTWVLPYLYYFLTISNSEPGDSRELSQSLGMPLKHEHSNVFNGHPLQSFIPLRYPRPSTTTILHTAVDSTLSIPILYKPTYRTRRFQRSTQLSTCPTENRLIKCSQRSSHSIVYPSAISQTWHLRSSIFW